MSASLTSASSNDGIPGSSADWDGKSLERRLWTDSRRMKSSAVRPQVGAFTFSCPFTRAWLFLTGNCWACCFPLERVLPELM